MNDETEPRPRLSVVPHKRSSTARVGIPCKRPNCSSVIEPNESGRPKDFCTPKCKQTYHRDRARVLRQLEVELEVARAYEYNFELSAAGDQATAPATTHAGGHETPDVVAPVGPPMDGVGDRKGGNAGEVSSEASRHDHGPTAQHEQLLARLLHEVSLAAARLDAQEGSAEAVAERLRTARDEIYQRLASDDA